MKVTSLVLMVSLTGAAALVGTACGTPAARCLPSDCPNGCCDTAGVCQPGILETACGQSGSVCGVCTAGQFCQTGICTSGNTGGSDAGGDGGQDGGTQDGGEGDGGTDDAGTPDGGGGYTASAFCTDYVEAFCGSFARCGQVSSKANCLGENLFAADQGCTAVLAPSIKDGRLVLDAAAATACFAYLENSAPCDYSGNPFLENASCTQALGGQGGAGAECYDFIDCNAAVFCDASTCPGSCSPRVGQNQTASTSEACAAGLYYYYANSTCRARVAAGGNCAPVSGSTEQNCVPGYYCSSTSTCTAKKGVGGTCPEYDECQAGLRCASTGTCQPYGTVGQACSGGSCTFDLTCNSATPQGSGTCTTLGNVGAGCWYSYSDCKRNLRCFGANTGNNVKGVCGNPLTQGQGCANSEECSDGLYCSGTCQAKKAGGQACASGQECLSWDCSNGVCGPEGSGSCVDPTP